MLIDNSDFYDSEKRVKESWARGVQWELTRMIYPGYVEGYTIRQIEDALVGITNWESWENNIKNMYNNGTEENLDELFDLYN